MKVSISIPQYNRIEYLLKSLRIIEQQTYPDIEVVISDDCSNDSTQEEIKKLIPLYKYPIIYSRNSKNEGYDRNFRKCIELSSGDYVLVIGNDDSLNGEDSICTLVDFVCNNSYPDVGFCNCVEERLGNKVMKRAFTSSVLGSGPSVALKYYSCFSFVGGIIFKKDTFKRYNSSKHDGSIYSQMYLASLMVADGATLFSIEEPLVIKDLLFRDSFRHSYRDRISKKWKDFRVVDGGLPSVINVIISAFQDSNSLTQSIVYSIHRRIYFLTFPFWIQDYKINKALPESVGLIIGLYPPSILTYKNLNRINRMKIFLVYLFAATMSLITPTFVFKAVKDDLYRFFKR